MKADMIANPRAYVGKLVLLELSARNFDLFYLFLDPNGGQLLVFDSFGGFTKSYAENTMLQSKLRNVSTQMWVGKPKLRSFIPNGIRTTVGVASPGDAFIYDHNKELEVFIATQYSNPSSMMSSPARNCFSLSSKAEPKLLPIRSEVASFGKVVLEIDQTSDQAPLAGDQARLQSYYEDMYMTEANYD